MQIDENVEILSISDSAVERIKELLQEEKNESNMLRIVVESGGCSGFQYKYELTKESDSNDVVLKKANVNVVVDNISAEFLKGSELQYIKELGAAYFKISNPNATAKCGCGNSFAV